MNALFCFFSVQHTYTRSNQCYVKSVAEGNVKQQTYVPGQVRPALPGAMCFLQQQ